MRLGFTQLATYLLDQPGSVEALHMQDKSGKVPEDIAREKGMKLLADMFSRYMYGWFSLVGRGHEPRRKGGRKSTRGGGGGGKRKTFCNIT